MLVELWCLQPIFKKVHPNFRNVAFPNVVVLVMKKGSLHSIMVLTWTNLIKHLQKLTKNSSPFQETLTKFSSSKKCTVRFQLLVTFLKLCRTF